MGIASGATAKGGGLAFISRFEFDAGELRRANELGAGHLQQPAVGLFDDDLLLRGDFDDHVLQVARLDRTQRHRYLEKLFHVYLTQTFAEAAELVYAAGKTGFKVPLATEDLNVYV
jgi:hypothetical protein